MSTELKIVNMVQAAPGVDRIEAKTGRFRTPAFSTDPCGRCDARCCHKTVHVTASCALTMSRALSLPLSFLVAPSERSHETGERFAAKFRVEDGFSVLRLSKNADGHCKHVVRPGTNTARCGIYALRPANCRVFPFVVDYEGERYAMGTQEGCPEQWLQTSAMRARLEDDMRFYLDDLAADRRIVDAWNAGEGPFSFDGFLTFLADWTEADET